MRRPSGTVAARLLRSSSLSTPVPAEMLSMAMGVSMSPGMIALARMPYLALPPASDDVSEFTAAFDVLYASMGADATAASDEMLTMAPDRCSRMTGTTCLHVSHMPLRFTSKMRSQPASLSDVTPPSPAPMPTLLTRTSMRPQAS